MKKNKIILVASLALFASEMTIAMKKSNFDVMDANISPAGIPIGASYSMRKTLEESESAKAATDVIKNKVQTMETQLQKQVEEYQATEAAFRAKELTMAPEAQAQEKKKLQKMQQALQEMYKELEEEVAKLQQETVNTIIMEIVKQVEALFADADFAILETDSGRITLGGAAQKKLDRTKDIIASLDAAHAKQKAEKAKTAKK